MPSAARHPLIRGIPRFARDDTTRHAARGTWFALSAGMSKHNPNQDFYKIGGRHQTDGPDRGNPVHEEKQEFATTEKQTEKQAHPAVKRAAKKK